MFLIYVWIEQNDCEEDRIERAVDTVGPKEIGAGFPIQETEALKQSGF